MNKKMTELNQCIYCGHPSSHTTHSSWCIYTTNCEECSMISSNGYKFTHEPICPYYRCDKCGDMRNEYGIITHVPNSPKVGK